MKDNDPFAKANQKIETLESNAINEVKAVVGDVKASNINFSDDKPILFKLVILLGAFSSFCLGFALYFIFKDDEKHKWTSSYFLIGSVLGAIVAIIKFIFFP